MEVKSDQFDIGQFQAKIGYIGKLVEVYTEFVFGQSGGDIMVRMGVDIWIDAYCHTGSAAFVARKPVDQLKFRNRLYVEASYFGIKTKLNFVSTFAHTGKYNFIWLETGIESCLYFGTAYAIRSESVIAYYGKQSRIGIGFDCVMHMKCAVIGTRVMYSRKGAFQQTYVIEIERSPQ